MIFKFADENMFRSIIKLAYDKQKFLARNYVRHARNPGIDRQLALLKDDHLQSNQEDLEQLDDADFTQVHKSHKNYEREAQQYRERLQSWIVGNKYFKTKQLNFLTWSEKEQIRYLHNYDPDEWSIEKLVESFPADRYTVAKVVKAKWIPHDEGRIKRHDESVRENWERFKSGRIKNIDEAFAEHLNKFVYRNFTEVCTPKVEYKKLYDVRPVPGNGEFSRIIASCKKYAKPVEQSEINQIGEMEGTTEIVRNLKFKAPNQDMFIMGEINDRQPQTLQQFKSLLDTRSASSSHQKEVAPNNQNHKTSTFEVKKYQSEMIASKNFEDNVQHNSDIMEFINIPDKVYRKGATYQLDDCFYDDDGEFLYRVPGMTGKRNN